MLLYRLMLQSRQVLTAACCGLDSEPFVLGRRLNRVWHSSSHELSMSVARISKEHFLF